MQSLVSFLSGLENLSEELVAVKNELVAELNKGAEKAAANREMYAAAREVVMNAIGDKPMTIAEIWEATKDEMPAGMTKSKVQYAMREYWADDVVKIEGKVNEYRRKA